MCFFPHAQNTDARGGTFNNVDGNQINGDQVNNIGQIIYHRPNNFDPLAQLSPVLDAVHNSIGSVSGCMEGTRQEVIGKIVRWIDGGGNQAICWLQGAAGAGKSAISRTIAELCAKSDRLVASFFFLRGAGPRSSITHLISTLAYNLAFSVPATRAYIENVLRRDPNILHRSLDHQFRALITEPMRSVRGLSLPMVIVIDALDECNDKSMIAEFIEIVARNRQLPLRFLFTSRVEEHIRERFSSSPALPTTYRLALQNFYANADLELYFRSRFSTIYEQKRRLMGNISLPWPSESDIAQLVERSDGSFIFASTLVNFVNDGSDLPHRKLRACLQSHAGLDSLYIQILQTAPRPPRFLQIFETIMTISEQLSIMDLACIFQVETGDVVHALLGVQSILIVPEDDNQPVRPFHTSLRDFLTTRDRSEDFFINPPTRHLSIASDCLTAMTSCNGDEIFESGALRFTARSWIKHFLCAIQEDGADNILCSQDGAVMINKLIDFLSLSFDSWLNSIIYQRQIKKTTEDLDKVISLLNVHEPPSSMLSMMEKITVFAKSDEKSFRDTHQLSVYPGTTDDYYGGPIGGPYYTTYFKDDYFKDDGTTITPNKLKNMVQVRFSVMTCACIRAQYSLSIDLLVSSDVGACIPVVLIHICREQAETFVCLTENISTGNDWSSIQI